MCGCDATYVGRTERQLQARVSEHVPRWLDRYIHQSTLNTIDQTQGQLNRLPNSAIGRHLIETGHCMNAQFAFKILARSRNKLVLRFAEALAIKRLKPSLCIQKDFVINLALPW